MLLDAAAGAQDQTNAMAQEMMRQFAAAAEHQYRVIGPDDAAGGAAGEGKSGRADEAGPVQTNSEREASDAMLAEQLGREEQEASDLASRQQAERMRAEASDCAARPASGVRGMQSATDEALARQLQAEIDGSDGGQGAAKAAGAAPRTGTGTLTPLHDTRLRWPLPQFLENANHGGNAAQFSFSKEKAAATETETGLLMETETAKQMAEDEWMQHQPDEESGAAAGVRGRQRRAGWGAGTAAASTSSSDATDEND